MAISLKHAFNSGKADGVDTTLVQPSNWNAEHTLQLATGKLLGRTTASTGAVEEIAVSGDLLLSSGTLGINTSVATLTDTQTLTNKTLTSPTITTSATVPLIIGGTAVSSALTLQSTSGVGSTDSVVVKVGNNGATTALSVDTTGIVTLPTTGAVKLPSGTTVQQPTGVTGMIRFNTTDTTFEGYNGTAWAGIGGGAVGGGVNASVSTYTDQVFLLNSTTVQSNYTIPTNDNAGTFGPVTVNSGVTVTVPSGSTWSIV